MEYDLFISYASEDRAEIVLPVVDLLDTFGLKVWLDERALDVGDSLSEAIDRGLTKSRYGVVVLSPSFFHKRQGWPGYELRSLNAREIGSDKVILPIWHQISREDVLTHSPVLADKFALDTSKYSIGDIALRILKVVRPDIFQHMYRWTLFKAMSKGPLEYYPLGKIQFGPINHDTLPAAIILRCRLVYEVLRGVSPLSWGDVIDNMRREPYPESEMIIWDNIAAAFLVYTHRGERSLAENKKAFATMLSISMQTQESLAELLVENSEDKEFWELASIYASVNLLDSVEADVAPNSEASTGRRRSAAPRG